MSNKVKFYLKTLVITLCLLFIIVFSFYVYKNTHNAITLNGEQTKAFIFNGIAYDIYQLRPFEGTMSSVRKNITYKVNVHNGKVNGKIIGYYSNGNLKSIQVSKKGNGCSLFYYENGNLEAKYCLKNGQFDGIQEMFYENGNKKVQGFLQEGKPMGIALIFRENGLLLFEIDYDKTMVKEFDEKGMVKTLNGNEASAIIRMIIKGTQKLEYKE